MRLLLLPIALPLACAWVKNQERRILRQGQPLDAAQLADARTIGIDQPERIRVLCLDQIPLPGGWVVGRLGRALGLIDETAGLSARYGVFIRAPFASDRRLLVHELTHTHQYERLGGIRPFLRQYLRECLTCGYASAPLEWEARETAQRLCRPVAGL